MQKSIVIGAHNRNHHSFYHILMAFLYDAGHTVTLITYQDILKYMTIHPDWKFDVVYLDVAAKLSDEYKKQVHFINTHDVFIFDEYYDNLYQKWLFQIKCDKNIYIIHNLNKWLKYTFTINIKEYLKTLIKKLLMQRFDALIVVNPVLKENIFKKFTWKKKVFFVPFTKLSTETTGYENERGKSIVIPGTVDNKRRDYNLILDVFEAFYKEAPTSDIKLVILGSHTDAEGQEIIDRCKKINLQYPNKIIFYESFIPSDEFNLQLKNAAYILSNLATEIKLDNNTVEAYGETKETGINYLILEHEKVAIIHQFFKNKVTFQDQALFYDSFTSLITLLEKIHKNEINVKSFKANAFKNKQNFNRVIENERIHLIEFIS